jgi:hypothetical protein
VNLDQKEEITRIPIPIYQLLIGSFLKVERNEFALTLFIKNMSF